MAYANGRLPASALALIPGTGRYIAVELLPQVVALRAAFKARFGKDLVITDGYRSYEGQVAARNRYLNGQGAYAVPPGTSNHGLAKAIDFGSRVNILGSAEHNWMVENAPRFGFVWLRKAGNGSIEPWHFDGSAVPASNYVNIPGVPDVPDLIAPEPIVPKNRKTEMFRLINTTGDVYLLIPGVKGRTHLGPEMNKLHVRMDKIKPGVSPLANEGDPFLQVEIDRIADSLGK